MDARHADHVLVVGWVRCSNDVEGGVELSHGVVAAMDLGHDGAELLGACCVEHSLFEQGADQSTTVIWVHCEGVDEQCVVDVDRTVKQGVSVGDDTDDEASVVYSDVDVCVAGSCCDFVGNVRTDQLLNLAGVPEASISTGERSERFSVAGLGRAERVSHAESGAGFGGSTLCRWSVLEQLSDHASLGRGWHEPQA